MLYELKNHLRHLRKQKKWTQADLALKVGVSRQTIISIEKGKYIPSVKLVLLLAHTLQSPVETLFWLEFTNDNKLKE